MELRIHKWDLSLSSQAFSGWEVDRTVSVGGPHCLRKLGTSKSHRGAWRVLRDSSPLTDTTSH